MISDWEEWLMGRGVKKVFKKARLIVDKTSGIQSLIFNEIPFGDEEILDGREIIAALVETVAEIFRNDPGKWIDGPVDQTAYTKITERINTLGDALHIDNFDVQSVVNWNLQNSQVSANLINDRNNLNAQVGIESRGSAKIPFEDWYPIFKAAGWTGGGEEDGYRTIEDE